MDHRNVPRHVWEGMLNGAGFVIGSALAGWIFVHFSAILAFVILIILLCLMFRKSLNLRSRFRCRDVNKFIRAIRSSAADGPGISSQNSDQAKTKSDLTGLKGQK